jgi:hypothetical protein
LADVDLGDLTRAVRDLAVSMNALAVAVNELEAQIREGRNQSQVTDENGDTWHENDDFIGKVKMTAEGKP